MNYDKLRRGQARVQFIASFDEVKELIKKGVSVTEVADITGFCDYGYFGKTFKKITGYTPTQINRK